MEDKSQSAVKKKAKEKKQTKEQNRSSTAWNCILHWSMTANEKSKRDILLSNPADIGV